MTEFTAPTPVGIELITIPEIAYMGGVLTPTAEYWRIRYQDTDKQFPEPDDVFGDKPVWRLERAIEWFEHTGKTYDVKRWRKHRDAGGFRRARPVNAK